MKKVLIEKYNKEYATEIMEKSEKTYRELVDKAENIGDDTPMAYNELFALSFVAPYIASEKKIPPETIQEMMPLFCELDEVMITLQHGILHRKQTLASVWAYCDHFITGNKE